MKKSIVILLLLTLCFSISEAGRNRKKSNFQNDDVVHMGYGFYYENPDAYGMSLRVIGLSKNAGLGIILSPGVEIGKLVQFANYSLSGDLMIALNKEFDTYLTLGWRHSAQYLSAHSRGAVSWFNGPTVGVGYDLWQPHWLPKDRITINAHYWFSKTVSALMHEPAPRKIVISITYYFI
ncbi:MAG: hypothetical protein WC575_02345 [Patescibacteria group bacterium]